MALEFSVEDVQLPQSVDELRILRRSARIANRSIESPENLLESVIVAFAVAARKIGVVCEPLA